MNLTEKSFNSGNGIENFQFFFKSVRFHQRFHEKKFPRSHLLELLTPISISTDRHVNLVLGLFLGDANYNFNQLSIYVVTLYAWKMETMEISANFSHNYLKLICLFTYSMWLAFGRQTYVWLSVMRMAAGRMSGFPNNESFFLQQG